jgi:hypothetical protein
VGILKDVLISLGAVSILDPLSAPLSVPQSRCSSLTGTVLLHGIDHNNNVYSIVNAFRYLLRLTALYSIRRIREQNVTDVR